MKRGFLFGVMVGVIAGLFLAPKRGEEFRDEVCERITEFQTSTLKPTIERFMDRARPNAEDDQHAAASEQVSNTEEQTTFQTTE